LTDYQTILHFTAATDYWGPKTCKAPRSPKCRHSCVLQAGCPSCRPNDDL